MINRINATTKYSNAARLILHYTMKMCTRINFTSGIREL